jgi:hypothetical protein
VATASEDLRAVHEARCVFCQSEIQYISEMHNANQNRNDLLALALLETKAMSHAAK